MENEIVNYIIAGKALALLCLFGYIVNISRKLVTQDELAEIREGHKEEIEALHQRITDAKDELRKADERTSDIIRSDIRQYRTDIDNRLSEYNSLLRELNTHLLERKRG